MGALGAFGLGLLAQSSLLVAGLVACRVTVPRRVVGALAGFGAGALLAAISFDLLAEAAELDFWELGAWMFVGVAVIIFGDRYVEHRFGTEGEGAAMGIVVGAVVDGIPESTIFGIQLATALAVSTSFLLAVLVSNIPEALAPSAELRADGWSVRRIARLWLLVVVACAAASAIGYLAAHASTDVTGERIAALAAGGLLAMLANSLMPFAYERGGELAGVAVVIGFCVSLALS